MKVQVVIPTHDDSVTPGAGAVTKAAASTSEPRLVWLEDNRYGAQNINTYADKVYHAADRMLSRYPTSSVQALSSEDLTVLGLFDKDSGTFDWTHPEWHELLTRWLGHPPTSEDLSVTHLR